MKCIYDMLCKSYGVLVWEIATYAELPHEQLEVSELIKFANNGTLQLDR